MATKETTVKEVKATVRASTYTIAELVEAHNVIGARPEVIKVALSMTGKDRFTEKDAISIINAFLKREVK